MIGLDVVFHLTKFCTHLILSNKLSADYTAIGLCDMVSNSARIMQFAEIHLVCSIARQSNEMELEAEGTKHERSH